MCVCVCVCVWVWVCGCVGVWCVLAMYQALAAKEEEREPNTLYYMHYVKGRHEVDMTKLRMGMHEIPPP